MAIPLHQVVRVGSYIMKQKLLGRKRYPMVLMMEPLFRCNLACSGCGKIDYPDDILNQRISVEDALASVDECGAPVVVLAGGEPLLHKELDKIVEGIIARKKYAIVCSNALLMEKRMDKFKPSPFFSWSVHLDGDREMHDKSVCEPGVYDRAIEAIKLAKARGFRVQINCTLFNDMDPPRVAAFFDHMMQLGIDGITVSPGYAYERAPVQDHFLSRSKTRELFRDVFSRGRGGKAWNFTASPLYIDFLAGNQTYECSPWSMPCRNVFGWQRPCYLLGEGYAKTFKELMEDTAWDDYGVGNYEKCANCMVHSGFEGTAVNHSVANPIKAAMVTLFGVKTSGPMVPDISLDKQRPAQYVFSSHVQKAMADIHAAKTAKTEKSDAAAAE
jgi:hopanoid biosynthesis associated radical SAM protein HpnH